MRKLQFVFGCRITKNVFKKLGKVAMSQKLLVIEVTNIYTCGIGTIYRIGLIDVLILDFNV